MEESLYKSTHIMPSKKQPQSLSELCSRRAADIAVDACLTITQHHGQYENSSCRAAIVILRNFFLENVGPSFESVCVNIYRSRRTRRFPKDARIWLDFIFHKKKETISLPAFVEDRLNVVPFTSAFLAEQLAAMKRITYLDLTCTLCTDDIIKAISDNCRHLEELRIACLNIGQNRITDEGLLLLKKCTDLRIIFDYAHFILCQVSVNTIRSLVLSLPRLIAINYQHMGKVLLEGFQNMVLPLKSVHEDKAEGEHIKAIMKLCPNLERISLKKLKSDSNEILYAFTDSHLKVETLALCYFTFPGVAPLLKEKGKYLRTLKIYYPPTYDAREDITLIGLKCPFLTHLTWVTKRSNIGPIAVDDRYKMTKQEEQEIFLNLKTLKLFINTSDFNLGIPQLCLLNASKIEDLVIIVHETNVSNDYTHALFSQILLRNTMTNLNSLRMRGSILSSTKKGFELIFSCLKQLKQFFYISKMNEEVLDYFKIMESKILENNLEMQLIWRNLTDDSNLNDLSDIAGFVDDDDNEEDDEDDDESDDDDYDDIDDDEGGDDDENLQAMEGINEIDGDGDGDEGDEGDEVDGDDENDVEDVDSNDDDIADYLLYDWLL